MVLAEAGQGKQPPATMPLPVARAAATISEQLARLTHRPPLIATGALHFLLWQARPSSVKAQRELGWKPTPLREGLKVTMAFLNEPFHGTAAVQRR